MKSNFTINDLKVYLIGLGALTLLLIFTRPLLGLFAICVFAYMVYYAYQQAEKINLKILDRVERLSADFEKTTEHAIFNMPFPLVITDREGKIIWYNSPFLKLIERGNIMDLLITDVIDQFKEINF